MTHEQIDSSSGQESFEQFIIEIDSTRFKGLELYQTDLVRRYRELAGRVGQNMQNGILPNRNTYRSEGDIRIAHNLLGEVIKKLVEGKEISVSVYKGPNSEEVEKVEYTSERWMSSTNYIGHLPELIIALGFDPAYDTRLSHGFTLKPINNLQRLFTSPPQLLEN